MANLLAKAAPTAGAATVDFAGAWENQLGSVMRLTVTGQGVSGRYVSPVSGGGAAVEGDITGYVDGDLIAIVVNWDATASLTAWTGQLVSAGGAEDTIKTLWHLVMNVPDPDEATGLWQSTFAGADVFRRG